MKNMIRVVTVAGLVGFATLGWAEGEGTTAGDFLTLGSGSRLAGMGNAGIADVDDASALYWNPGAMTSVKKQSAVFMHTSYLESSAYSHGNYVQNLGDKGAWGVGINYFSSGDLEQRDTSGQDTGSFTPNDLALSVGYAKKLGATSVGIGAKYIKTTIVDSASTLALDIGVQSRPLYKDRLSLAASATNLGGKIKYNETGEDLPQEFRVGAGYRLTPKIKTVLDIASPKSGDTYVAGGVEFAQSFNDAWAFSGRTGYSTRTAGDVSGLTGVTFGIGVSRGALGFDYALVPQGDLGMTHWIALVYRESRL